MKLLIKYADDDYKKERLINYVKANPGVRTHDMLNDLGMCNRTYQKVLKELKTSGLIVIKNGYHGALLHYAVS